MKLRSIVPANPNGLLDLRMSGLNGVETIGKLREEFGDVRVLVFSPRVSSYASGDAKEAP